MPSYLMNAIGQVAKQAGDAIRESVVEDKRRVQPAVPNLQVEMYAGSTGKVVPLACPKCGASVEQPADAAGAGVSFCAYCGASLLVDDGAAKVTYRTVDEARIRQLELEEARELRRLEIAERRRPGKIKASIALAIIGAVMLIGGYFLAEGSGDSNSAWFMVSIIGYFPLLAIPFIWVMDTQTNGTDDPR